MLKELIQINRSYRKFKNSKAISRQVLMNLIELTRYAPSSKNRQPLKYILVSKPDENAFVFNQLKWAWYIRDWDGPAENERPPAYIIMLIDKQLNDKADFDAGIAAQTILLGAVEQGLGGCIIRTVNRYELGRFYELPPHMDIVMVIAIGEPDQKIVLEEEDTIGNMEYWVDEKGVHHVPKRSLMELIYK
jgi:nitroreductase